MWRAQTLSEGLQVVELLKPVKAAVWVWLARVQWGELLEAEQGKQASSCRPNLGLALAVEVQ